jgi:hypothetical protein
MSWVVPVEVALMAAAAAAYSATWAWAAEWDCLHLKAQAFLVRWRETSVSVEVGQRKDRNGHHVHCESPRRSMTDVVQENESHPLADCQDY